MPEFEFPTSLPSIGPSIGQSEPPKSAPTAEPSNTPKPIESPEVQPPSKPTTDTTTTTTPNLTGQPTVTVTVPLPQLRFVLDATGTLEEASVNAAVVAFLNFFFSQGFYRDAFLYVTLQTNLVDGTLGARQQTRRRRRHLWLSSPPPPTHPRNRKMEEETVVTLQVQEGMATYNPDARSSDGTPSPVPSEEELSAILAAYFSLWGTEKLLEYFKEDGLPVAGVSQVSIDGDVIMMEKDVEETNSSPSGSGSDNEAAILAGSIVGAGILVVVAVALLVHRQRRRKAAHREIVTLGSNDFVNNNNSSAVTAPSLHESERSLSESKGVLPPRRLPPPASSMAIPAAYQEKTINPYATNSTSPFSISMAPTKTTSEDDHDSVSESDGDIISVTESLHHQHEQGPLAALEATNNGSNVNDLRPLVLTGKTSVRQQPPNAPQPGFQYDSSRLDQVISNAKKQGQADQK